MIRNYFSIAWRNLVKNKLYSFINIGGLAVGISACMLILLYVAHEMSYDKFHKNAGRIFFAVMNTAYDGKQLSIDRMTYESGPMLKEADPQIESYVRVEEIYDNRVIENLNSPDKKFTERNICFVDSNFFDFFSFRLIQGDLKNVLNRPFTMVISERAALKYFGKTNPVGKLLKYDDSSVFEITGIASNPPSNSSINYDFIGSLSSFASTRNSTATNQIKVGGFKTFILLRNGANVKASTAIVHRLAGMTDGGKSKFNFELNKLANRHNDYDNTANAKYKKIFSWVAFLILFLALINYMSLATARSATRSKEVGVRKVLGASRNRIVNQFYVESSLYAIIAFVFGLILFGIMRPGFYDLLQLNIDEIFLSSAYSIGIFAGLLLVTIIISGSYPSLVLSSFKPVKVLYGKLSKQKGGAVIRRFFTVLQFTISVALIISSIIINQQLEFLRHTDTGIQREHIIMIPFQKNISQHYLAFKRSVEEIKGIEAVSTSAAQMYGGIDMTSARFKDNHDILVSEMFVDQHFFEMLGMRWKIAPPDQQLPAQKGQVVINEEMINKFNLPENPIGEQIVIGNDSVNICGVLKNFNFTSLHHKIEPLCLVVLKDTDSAWYADNGDCLFAKIAPHTNVPELLESIQSTYVRFDKQSPFEYRFLDEAFDAQYRAENRLSRIFEVFTFITIFIACLGLFGLAAFSAAQRTKEIGIRKVLGAGTISIINIIFGNFIKPVFISILIAIPLAWLFMDQWLQDFAYRAPVSWWIFVLAALVALFIALATVSFHAIKAAIANPVNSLRSE